ncbi:MAG: vWA domain-containing protein [Tepidisphaeraceae bacterium]
MTSPIGLVLAGALGALVIATVAIRRPQVPRSALLLASAGLILLVVSAGRPVFDFSGTPKVVVMVDLSASTRGASYRNQATLSRTIDQLLGSVPFRVVYFAADNRTNVTGATLPDISSRETRFAPPPADVVVLFSDARFAAPSSAPATFVVIDPSLEKTDDAQVRHLEVRQKEVLITAQGDETRTLTATGTLAPFGFRLIGGPVALTLPRDPTSHRVVATIAPQDAWPENDTLEAVAPVANERVRWWVGKAGPTGWTRIEVGSLATDPASYLAPSVIAIEQSEWSKLSATSAAWIEQYVRDLGGAVLMIQPAGAALERISPLSNFPPTPTTHWIVLVDASGSMSGAAGSRTRWDQAVEALSGLLGAIPPDDPVSVGSFARDVRWWSQGMPARELIQSAIAPADVQPQGPTNLEAALSAVVSLRSSNLPTELLIVTDAQAVIDDPAKLADELVASRVRVHALATSTVPEDNALRKIVRATHGEMLSQSDPTRWAGELRELYSLARPSVVQHDSIQVEFDPRLKLPPDAVTEWNRVWERDGATTLASARWNGAQIPLAAAWSVGLGQVAAIAFSPGATQAEAIAAQIENPPRDPRFALGVDAGARLSIRLDATDGGTFLNDLRPEVILSDDAGTSRSAIPQTGPGRYEVSLSEPASPKLAVVVVEGRIVSRFFVASRYAPEVETIGNDRDAMRELAARTGGELIEPGRIGRLNLPRPTRGTQLSSAFAIGAAILLGAALVQWRRA